MEGAREYAGLFKTGQYGRLYIVSSSHARGKTFRIYVLPDGEEGLPNGSANPPLNKDAVEVYGVISGNPGWTESYGWIHQGKWKGDFLRMADLRRQEILMENKKMETSVAKNSEEITKKKLDLLSTYQ